MSTSRKRIQRARRKLHIITQKASRLVLPKSVPRDPFNMIGYRIVDIRRKTIEFQQKLAVALRFDERNEANDIIRRILRNKEVRLYAVYLTISATGSRTKGIYDANRPTKVEHYQKLASDLWNIVKNPNKYSAQPLKRVYIPKPGKNEDRPISVPSYLDRCTQHLFNFVLSVFQEELADPNSFGFRPFRSPGMAAKAVTLQIWSRAGFGPPKHALELDIRKCFDSIAQKYIIEKVANTTIRGITYEVIPPNIMHQWLNSGYIDIQGKYSPKEQIIPTDRGVPQGGPISPTVSNMVLNGIEDVVWKAVGGQHYITWDQTLSPHTKIIWYKDGKEILCTFGCTNNVEIYNLLKQINAFEDNFRPNYLRSKARLTQLNMDLKYHTFVDVSLDTPEKREANNNKWSSTIRFADDCVILLNSNLAAQKAKSAISSFLAERGLEIHPDKTVIKNLYANQSFRFCGFEFRYKRNHGKTVIYNYPPPDKVKNLQKKVEKILQDNKRSPYICFSQLNSVLRGWLNFYSSGNSKSVFSDIRSWLYWQVRYYLFNLHSQNFKSKSRIRRKKLNGFIYHNYYASLSPNTANWWYIPQLELPANKQRRYSKGYPLINPGSIKVTTSSIITGKSAFFPEERLQLISKANGWKSGFINEIMKKHNYVCPSCSIPLNSEEVKPEIHHITPIKYGGLNIPENCICLCSECHKEISLAVQTKNISNISYYESVSLLKNVQKKI